MNMLRAIPFGLAFALAASAAHAQAGLSDKQPVEINSDQLEVLQQDNLAIFTGNVIAVQGTTKINSDKMVVHYRKKDAAPGAPAAPAGAMDQSTVERIDFEGHVLLTTPKETASGDTGIYEVPKKLVYLNTNVVLTQGENILKGETLVHDFNTGKSVINSPFHTPQGPQAPAGRVRALFMPEKKQ